MGIIGGLCGKLGEVLGILEEVLGILGKVFQTRGGLGGMLIYIVYSSGRKSMIFCFAQLLQQILVNFQNQGGTVQKSACVEDFKNVP